MVIFGPAPVPCWKCDGSGWFTPPGSAAEAAVYCPRCGGDGELESDQPQPGDDDVDVDVEPLRCEADTRDGGVCEMPLSAAGNCWYADRHDDRSSDA